MISNFSNVDSNSKIDMKSIVDPKNPPIFPDHCVYIWNNTSIHTDKIVGIPLLILKKHNGDRNNLKLTKEMMNNNSMIMNKWMSDIAFQTFLHSDLILN